ncbi:serine/threonine-protein kinase [Acanthopleuribacter pedis]|uniref:Serine/threonine protein kinase n=1 Tax=Acanthopleuribacter pedis TaxID=442870 RepID=A0A8J7U7F5_9BACT|nr:serine/threonine-protein kinase [Acanthopleuribacter pedis]MBO1322453.1 serine/threonine protein kinase [Acanthopleuribacter pedis]
MSFERFQQVDDLFQRALDLPKAEWDAFLDAECGDDASLKSEVLTMLFSDEAAEQDEFLNRAEPFDEPPPEQVGPYRIKGLLGEGGTGSVYQAHQQEPVARDVALKIIKPGMDTQRVLKRFRQEKQTLARMNHPYIAQVFDAGVTERGRPYFAMELIQGRRITDFCDHHRLTLDQRLALFEKVCEAMRYSHQKGVIHRDLKPANILVTDEHGQSLPKVIDFGIAKATAPGDSQEGIAPQTVLTMVGTALGTLAYMSPEQATIEDRDLDTRTDIYSLGVLLYELLCDTQPHPESTLSQIHWNQAFRIIREEEPLPPTARVRDMPPEALQRLADLRATTPAILQRRLRGDLDWITRKCLAKEREQRYESVGALIQDIQAFRENRPIAAGKPDWRYLAAKFFQRHRLAVFSGLVMLAALVLAAFLAAVGKIRADRGLALAELEATRATQSQQHLTEFLTSVDPNNHGKNVALAELLDEFGNDMDRGLETDPVINAFLHHTLGNTYLNLGLTDQADRHLSQAVTERAAHLGKAHLETLRSRRLWALLQARLGRHEAALTHLEKDAFDLKQQLAADHPEHLQHQAIYARCLIYAGRTIAAQTLLQDLHERSARLLGDNHPQTLDIGEQRGVLSCEWTAADAAGLLEDLLARRQKIQGIAHPATPRTMHLLGDAYRRAGCTQLAAAYYEDAFYHRTLILGPDHAHTLASQGWFAVMLHRSGRKEEGRAVYDAMLERLSADWGPHPSPVLMDLLASREALFSR